MTKPDKWVVVKITINGNPVYKVYATWLGGYLDGDSWKMNSGITHVYKDDDHILFYGYSGSCYRCSEGAYGTNFYTQSVLDEIISKGSDKNCPVEVMPLDTDWLSLNNLEDEN